MNTAFENAINKAWIGACAYAGGVVPVVLGRWLWLGRTIGKSTVREAL